MVAIISVRSPVSRERAITSPMPVPDSAPEKISPATRQRNAIDQPSSTPVMIPGSAAGSTTRLHERGAALAEGAAGAQQERRHVAHGGAGAEHDRGDGAERHDRAQETTRRCPARSRRRESTSTWACLGARRGTGKDRDRTARDMPIASPPATPSTTAIAKHTPMKAGVRHRIDPSRPSAGHVRTARRSRWRRAGQAHRRRARRATRRAGGPRPR